MWWSTICSACLQRAGLWPSVSLQCSDLCQGTWALLIKTGSHVSGSLRLVSRGYFLSFLPAPAQAGSYKTVIEVISGRSPTCIWGLTILFCSQCQRVCVQSGSKIDNKWIQVFCIFCLISKSLLNCQFKSLLVIRNKTYTWITSSANYLKFKIDKLRFYESYIYLTRVFTHHLQTF